MAPEDDSDSKKMGRGRGETILLVSFGAATLLPCLFPQWFVAAPALLFLTLWLWLALMMLGSHLLMVPYSERLTVGTGYLLRIAAGTVVVAFVLIAPVFIAWTVVLHAHGVIDGSGGTGLLGMGRAGITYARQVIDGIPLLDVADTLGWEAPDWYQGTIVGLMLIAMKVAVVVPVFSVVLLLLRLNSPGWEGGASPSSTRGAQFTDISPSPPPRMQFKDTLAPGFSKMNAFFSRVILALAVTIATYLAFRWVNEIGGLALALGASGSLLVWALITGLRRNEPGGRAVEFFRGAWTDPRRHPRADVVHRAILVVAMFELFTYITALLARLELLSFSPSSSDMDETRIAENFYLWHTANALPGLDVTTTLGWRLSGEVEGWLGGVLLLVFKLAVFVPAALLLAAAIRDFQSGLETWREETAAAGEPGNG